MADSASGDFGNIGPPDRTAQFDNMDIYDYMQATVTLDIDGSQCIGMSQILLKEILYKADTLSHGQS